MRLSWARRSTYLFYREVYKEKNRLTSQNFSRILFILIHVVSLTSKVLRTMKTSGVSIHTRTFDLDKGTNASKGCDSPFAPRLICTFPGRKKLCCPRHILRYFFDFRTNAADQLLLFLYLIMANKNQH